jgi:septum formation protein
LTRLVLASASTSRAQILRDAGVPFEVRPAHVDEDAVKASGGEGAAVAAKLAELKALRVSSAQPDALVLGADQVLVCGGKLLSKAETRAEAAAQLQFLRGKPHTLISALALARDGAVIWRLSDEARLTMRDFSDAFLDAYLNAEGEAMLGSVGCYRLEGLGAQLFESVQGDYFSILGLPLIPLLAILREHGVIAR